MHTAYLVQGNLPRKHRPPDAVHLAISQTAQGMYAHLGRGMDNQLRQLLMACKFDTGDIAASSFDTCDSCGAALVPVLNGTLPYNVSIPDAGEFERGLCGENEMIFTFAGENLEALIGAVRDLIAKGFGFRQLAYDLKADYARPKFYNDMFAKWGLETGEEWIPGQR